MNIDAEAIAAQLGIPAQHISLLMGAFIEEAKGILDALESAIQTQDFKQIALHAHSIKGSSANLRIDEVSQIALKLEQAGKALDAKFDYATQFTVLKELIATIPV